MVLIDTNPAAVHARVTDALAAGDASVRLRAALAVGSDPDPGHLDPLVERCGVEPDFFVRDMLSWALTRLPPELVVPRLQRELGSARAQARSQALHTLSKIGDRSAWPWVSRDLLRDPDDEVARTAWRVAVLLVPEEDAPALADDLVGQLGRGDRAVQLSLSRALVALGDVVGSALEQAAAAADPAVAAHARATARLLADPETGLDAAVAEARRIVDLGPGTAAVAAPPASLPTEVGPGAPEPGEAAERAGC